MDNDLRLLLSRYLRQELPLEAVDSWISQNIWDAEPEVDDSIDQVAICLVEMDESIIDETEFRRVMMERLGFFHYVEPGTLNSWSRAYVVAVTDVNRPSSGYLNVTPGESNVTGTSSAITLSAAFAA